MNNYNLIRKAFIIVILFSLTFTFFTTFSSGQKLDDLAYIVSIGIDKGDKEKYKISFQISTVQSTPSGGNSNSGSSGNSGGASSSSGKSSSYIVNTIECNSIDAGIGLINTYVNKTVNLSHCKVVLISDAIAKDGVSDIIYTLVNKVEIRPDCNIIVSKIKAEDFVNTIQPSTQDVLSTYFNMTSGNSEKQETEYTQLITLSDFYSYLKDPISEPYASLGTISSSKGKTLNKKQNNNQDNTSGLDKVAGDINSKSNEPLVELLGLAVFKGDKLVGELSGIETICNLILTNKLKETTITVPSPFDNSQTVDLIASMNSKPKIHVYINNNTSPYITVDANIVTRLLSFNNNVSDITQDKINQVEASAKNYLTSQLYGYLYKTSKDLKSDITSLGIYGAKNFSTQQEWNNYNWSQSYETSSFNVNVNLTLKSGYLLSNK